MKVLMIAGSPSANSKSVSLLKHIGKILGLSGHSVELLEIRSLDPYSLVFADIQNSSIKNALEKVNSADLIVLGTPVYKASYSGLLKIFLDLLPQNGLKDKIVLPVATAGSASHMLVLDYALRPVLSSLSAKNILPGLFVTDQQLSISESGHLLLVSEITNRLSEILKEIPTPDNSQKIHTNSKKIDYFKKSA